MDVVGDKKRRQNSTRESRYEISDEASRRQHWHGENEQKQQQQQWSMEEEEEVVICLLCVFCCVPQGAYQIVCNCNCYLYSHVALFHWTVVHEYHFCLVLINCLLLLFYFFFFLLCFILSIAKGI